MKKALLISIIVVLVAISFTGCMYYEEAEGLEIAQTGVSTLLNSNFSVDYAYEYYVNVSPDSTITSTTFDGFYTYYYLNYNGADKTYSGSYIDLDNAYFDINGTYSDDTDNLGMICNYILNNNEYLSSVVGANRIGGKDIIILFYEEYDVIDDTKAHISYSGDEYFYIWDNLNAVTATSICVTLEDGIVTLIEYFSEYAEKKSTTLTGSALGAVTEKTEINIYINY
ncbi:MAG: hypothetical protein R3Y23_02340 [Bacillota bacterium]